MPNKKRKCRYCKEYTEVEKGVIVPLGFFCSMEHVIAHGKEKAATVREKRERKERQERKIKLKTAGDYTREAQSAINKYVRVRDKNLPCVSCGRHHEGQYHAGHYKTTGAHPELRFNLRNIHKQCSVCNNHLSGNLINYRINLIDRRGLELVEWLEGKHELKKYPIEYLIRIKKIFNRKTRLYDRLFRV